MTRRSRIYLDYNATAPIRPAVKDAVMEAMEKGGNPSSVHGFGRDAAAMLRAARDRVAALAGVGSDAVVFTSGATEANNAVLQAPCWARRIVSGIEHDSVMAAARHAGDVSVLPVDAQGIVDLATLARLLAHATGPTVVAIMAANNETGVIQPVDEVAALCRTHGARFHCDAVQAAGKLDLGPIAAAADTLSLSAHKLGGSPGVGALIVNDPDMGDPDMGLRLIHGGGQESGLRAGTENLPGIVGFGRAAELASEDREGLDALTDLRDRMESRIREIAPAAFIAGEGAPRLANTSCLAMPGVPAETQVMAFDLAGIAVSAGAACSSGKVQRSHVLDAMGVASETADAAIRISLGWATRDRDIDRFVAAWTDLYKRTHAVPAETAAE